MCLSAAAIAHSADPPDSDSLGEGVTVTPQLLKQMNLSKHPKRSSRFELKIGANSIHYDCRLRFEKKDHPLAKPGCAFLSDRLNWGPRLTRSGEVKKRTTQIFLNWPDEGINQYESDFGGAFPVSIGEWLEKKEFGDLRKYKNHDSKFEIEIGISEDGRVDSCSVEHISLPRDLDSTICSQVVDHSFWLPAIDETGKVRRTIARLSSEIEISPGDCIESAGLSFEYDTGIFKWIIATGNDTCRFDRGNITLG